MLLEVFFLIIFVINLSKEENSEFINMSQFDSEYRKIVFDAFSLIMNISNQEVLNAEKDKNYPCLNKLSISLMNGNISTLINLSGQGLMKLGNEKECHSEGYEYYLFNFEIQPEIFDIKGHQDLSEFIGILSGSMILENLYNIPGIGSLFVNAINSEDYSVLMVDMAMFTVVSLVASVFLDISYGFIDPRIRMGAKNNG